MTLPLPNLAVYVDSSHALDVRRFAVEQRMSSLFEVTLTAFSADADLDFDEVVGQPARFWMHRRRAGRHAPLCLDRPLQARPAGGGGGDGALHL